MKCKLDENIPVELSAIFYQAGIDAITVLDEELSGVTDAILFEVVQAEKRVLITMDLDFSDIRNYPPTCHAGIIVLRPRSQDILSIQLIIRRLIPLLLIESLAQRLWIVDDKRIRIRE